MIPKFVIGVISAAAIVAACDGWAQKYPERRTVREGTKLYNAGRFEDAAGLYRRALDIEPGLREAQFNLANALFRQQKGPEAAKGWERIAADSLAPAEMVAAANFNTGNVALVGEQIDAAIESYKQALRIDPGDMQAKYNLAYARKLKQQQQQQNKNDKDKKDDKKQDQNKDQNDDQNDQQNRDKDDGEKGDNDDKDNNDNKDQDKDKGEDGDGKNPPKRDGKGSINPEDAGQMLDAMQDEEDKTREKVNARKVPAVGRSGKNW